MNAITQAATPDEIIEQVVVSGDLAKLTPAQRVNYSNRVCNSMGLNPLTRPFDYITLNNKLTLYAKRDAADQLRKLHGVSVQIVSRERIEDVFTVTAHATMPDGRSDESIGAVALGTLKGEALANALMKAETKAKRRVTLSIVGLGWLDETEIETIRDARPVMVDASTGEIIASGNGKQAQPEPTQPAQDTDPLIAKWLAEAKNFTHAPRPVNGQWGAVQGIIIGIVMSDDNRHRFYSLLFGREITSADELSNAEAAWLHAFVKPWQDKSVDKSWHAAAAAEQAIIGFMQRHPAYINPAPDFPTAADLHPESAHLEPA